MRIDLFEEGITTKKDAAPEIFSQNENWPVWRRDYDPVLQELLSSLVYKMRIDLFEEGITTRRIFASAVNVLYMRIDLFEEGITTSRFLLFLSF